MLATLPVAMATTLQHQPQYIPQNNVLIHLEKCGEIRWIPLDQSIPTTRAIAVFTS